MKARSRRPELVHRSDHYWTSWGQAGKGYGPPGAIGHSAMLCRSGDAHAKSTSNPEEVTCPQCKKLIEQGITTRIRSEIEHQRSVINA